MKELTIEEKAQRYDEAIERAESIYNETAIPSATTKGICTYIFPELNESEDKEVRDIIFDCLYKCWDSGLITKEQRTKCISWLEKQGEQPAKFADYKEAVMDIVYNYVMPDKIDEELRRIGKGEQNPKKIKPIFTAGDTIRHKKQGFTCKIIAVDKEYRLSGCKGNHLPFESQDAYELVEQESTEEHSQNPKDTLRHAQIEDKRIRKAIRTLILSASREQTTIVGVTQSDMIAWLDKQCEQKPAWSEEEEKKRSFLLSLLYEWSAKAPRANSMIKEDIIDWFKFLKDKLQIQSQWKPTEDQMKAFKSYIERGVIDKEGCSGKYLVELYEQLTNLKD